MGFQVKQTPTINKNQTYLLCKGMETCFGTRNNLVQFQFRWGIMQEMGFRMCEEEYEQR